MARSRAALEVRRTTAGLASAVESGHPGRVLLPEAMKKAETVEVVRIDSYERSGLTDVMRGEVVARWHGEQIREFRDVASSVPESALFLCFDPGWGVRVHGPAGLLFEAAFCFGCDLARWWGPEAPQDRPGATFQAGGPEGQKLLSLFRSCLPAGAEPPAHE